ncbi:Mechanosensitive ion channel [Granulibacter bethesdensis CGDNIH1]|uniref:Mechanosensitive ion channel n=2 Tax=Granulibacter bethesdensis TaxID=364410 RepID=Q0BR08_GRABC|nr:Mechanosensitive ion channel [Granulibacter bethesdensis CGDNIH1]APH52604.1 Mechanosensitive ion channel [Granulibacter bethesdensis]APH65293.1 Mechanosensitive ion channel [Granulibacter bethesdensis]
MPMSQKRHGPIWLLPVLLMMLVIWPACLRAENRAEDAAPPRPAPSSLTPDQTKAALEVLGDARKRDELIRILQTLPTDRADKASSSDRAQPPKAADDKAGHTNPAAATTPPPEQTKKDTPTTPNAASAKPDTAGLAPNSLGAELIKSSGSALDDAAVRLKHSIRSIAEAPLFYYWLQGQMSQPERKLLLVRSLVALTACMVAGGLAAWGTVVLTAPFLNRLFARHAASSSAETEEGFLPSESSDEDAEQVDEEDREEETPPERSQQHIHAERVLSRFPSILLAAIITALPVGAFLVTAGALLWLTTSPEIRGPATACIKATVFGAMVLVLGRTMLRPETKALRLIRIQDSLAQYGYRWLRRLIIVETIGAAIAGIGASLGLYNLAVEAILKITALAIYLCLVIIILQKRTSVAKRISHGAEGRGSWAALRRTLAPIWHWPALIGLAAFWLVWALEMEDGLHRLAHGAIVTISILTAARIISLLLLGLLSRIVRPSPESRERHPEIALRADLYYPYLKRLLSALLAVATLVILLQSWGIPTLIWFNQGAVGSRLLSALITIGVTVTLAVIIWESVNIASEKHLARLTASAQYVRSARMRTLLPMFRTALLIVILAIIIMTVLSEIGVNIAPLLAGAGIVGVAIGFGSQKLVQDLITGIFLLLENAMQVGDSVTLSGLSGTVEHLSIRTIRLRAGDGSVHIIPFSSVSTVTNANRGIGNAAISVTLALGEDTAKVSQIIRDIGAELREEEEFSDRITGDLSVFGVDKVDASGVTITGQIPCTDTGRTPVLREFNRRMYQRFQEAGIRFAIPQQAVTVLSGDIPDATPTG